MPMRVKCFFCFPFRSAQSISGPIQALGNTHPRRARGNFPPLAFRTTVAASCQGMCPSPFTLPSAEITGNKQINVVKKSKLTKQKNYPSEVERAILEKKSFPVFGKRRTIGAKKKQTPGIYPRIRSKV